MRTVVIGSLALVTLPFSLMAQAPSPASPALAQGQSAPAAPAASAPTQPRADRRLETIMFSIDEYNEIQSRIAGAAEDGRKIDTAIEDADLYLSTIVYNDPKDWTVWINGVPIGPNQDFQSFQVTSITPGYVELLVPLSAQGMRPVKLAPNQTFITKSGAIVEGRLR